MTAKPVGMQDGARRAVATATDAGLRRRNRAGLYVHIPYCRTVCPYCDFAVVRDRGERASYVDALTAAIGRDRSGILCDTLYIGGGTPSRLDDGALAAIVRAADAVRVPGGWRECTLEANPEDLKAQRLATWRRLGIDRLSVGVQRLDGGGLKRLGRARSAAAVRALPALLAQWRALGGTASVDVIYGLRDDTPAMIAEQVRTMAAWPIEHMSAYHLTVEAGTPLARGMARGVMHVAGDDAAAALYEAVIATIDTLGWDAYEVSNFAVPGHRAVHNFGYWAGDAYVGHGMGAVGAALAPGGWRRYRRHETLAAYTRDPTGQAAQETLDDAARRVELLLTGLRSDVGVPDAWRRAWPQGAVVVTRLVERGDLLQRADRWILTPRARLLADELAVRWAAGLAHAGD